MFNAAQNISIFQLLKGYRPSTILYRLVESVVKHEMPLDFARQKLSELIEYTEGFSVSVRGLLGQQNLSPEDAFSRGLSDIACLRLSTQLAYQRMTWLQVTSAVKRLAEAVGWDLESENATIQNIFKMSEKINSLKHEYEYSTFPVCASDGQFRLYMNRAFLKLLKCPIEDNDPLVTSNESAVDYFECMNHLCALPFVENIIDEDLTFTRNLFDILDNSGAASGHFLSFHTFGYFKALFNLNSFESCPPKDEVVCLRWIAEKRGDYYIAIAEDHTEKRRLSEEMSKRLYAEARAKLAEEMVHDVHNTLQVVLGNTELLKNNMGDLLHRLERQGFVSGRLRDNLLDNLRHFVEQVSGIELAANYQRELAMRILTDSKLRVGEMVLKQDPINLKSLLASAAKMYTVVAAEKSVLLHCQLPKVECYASGDYLAIQTILTNLIGNAIKFTQNGQIIIVLNDLGGGEEGKRRVTICVADTGIGMTPDECTSLMQQIKSDAKRLDSENGFGLGLSICQRLVNLMHGELEIESEQAVGTTVTVTLELDSLSPEQRNLLREEGWLAA